MSSLYNSLLLIGFILLQGSYGAAASDDNPWSMDESDNRRQPYFDLGNIEGAGSFIRDRRENDPSGLTPPISGHASKETIRPKSSAFPSGEAKGWESAPGKAHRNEVFGYSGPQPKIDRQETQSIDTSRFGAFPPKPGESAQARGKGAPARMSGGVQFEGKKFGAFPPLETGAAIRERQQRLRELRARERRERQRSSAFDNVPPTPVPEPLPERAYPPPYGRYGMQPGYGLRLGPGLDGLGLGVRPPLIDPMGPGILTPGLMW